MRAGDLDRWIRIEADTPTRDAAGGEVASWATFVEVWAKKRDTRGREFFAADQVVAEATAVFTVYWIDGLDVKMRLVDTTDSRVYDILTFAEIGGRRDAMEIAVKVLNP